MERSMIIKALKICSDDRYTTHLTYEGQSIKILLGEALSLIKELTEDNEKLTINMNAYGLTAKRLAEENAEQDKAIINALNRIKEVRQETKADTVKKMQEMFKEKLDISVEGYSTEEVKNDVFDTLDQIAKEMLNENTEEI